MRSSIDKIVLRIITNGLMGQTIHTKIHIKPTKSRKIKLDERCKDLLDMTKNTCI